MTSPEIGPQFSKDDFQSALNVSRETMADLSHYLGCLTKWQKTINLVSQETLEIAWQRHFLDSAQLVSHIPDEAESLLDMGSGAGLPGLVLAIMLKKRPNFRIFLVESNARKGAFLQQVIADLGLPAKVITGRLEAGPDILAVPAPISVITARALAPLKPLLDYASLYSGSESLCLFLKGQHIEDELTEAAKYWNMQSECLPSLSDSSGCLVKIRDFYPC